MTSTHDALNLTDSLVDWVRSVRPDANVRVVSSRPSAAAPAKTAPAKDIAIRLVRVEGLSGPRNGGSLSR